MDTLTAVAEVNGDPAMDIAFAPIERDPGGNIDLYVPLCAEILQDSDARHVFGFVTRAQVFGNPQHACTRRMIEAVPTPDPAHRRPVRAHLPVEAPSPIRPVVQGPQKVPLNDIGGGHLVAYALRTGEAAA